MEEAEENVDAPIVSKSTKGAPLELPSNRAVSRFRQVVHVPKKVRRDPRFDAAAGDLNTNAFNNSYSFLAGIREGELKALQRELGRCKDPERKRELQGEVTRLQQALSEGARQDGFKEAKRGVFMGAQEAVASGAQPFFPKRRDLKELEAVEKFKSLEAAGGSAAVERALKKRREKMSKKDRTKLPARGGRQW